MHIFMHTFHYLMFSLWHCKALVEPGIESCSFGRGAQLQRSPLQYVPVRFTCGKLRLVGEVSPFDSEFTVRRSLTWMQSGTLSKSAEGDFFVQFWQGGAQLWRSPPQHLPVRFAHSKLCLVGEMSPFDSEFTARGSLTRMRSGTPSKSAKGNFFVQFWQGGAQLWRSPLQDLPVRFTCGKLHLVGEVSPFDSKFTMRRSLTWMQSGTPSKLAEGNFFRGLLFTF